MFQFPSLAPAEAGSPVLPGLSFLIRVSRDQHLFASSPELIAGSYALHRLLTPRHPPCALSYFSTKNARLRRFYRHSVYHHPYTCFKEQSSPHPSLDSSSSKYRLHRPSHLGPSKPGSSFCFHQLRTLRRVTLGFLKGGDPAAGSPTATLLRLHPNHQPDRWRLPP